MAAQPLGPRIAGREDSNWFAFIWHAEDGETGLTSILLGFIALLVAAAVLKVIISYRQIGFWDIISGLLSYLRQGTSDPQKSTSNQGSHSTSDSVLDDFEDDDPEDPCSSSATHRAFQPIIDAKSDQVVYQFFDNLAKLKEELRKLISSSQLPPGETSPKALANALARIVVSHAEIAFRTLLHDEGCVVYMVHERPGHQRQLSCLYRTREEYTCTAPCRPQDFEASRYLRLRESFPGRVFDQKKPKWLPDVTHAHKVVDEKERARLEGNGTRSCVAWPITIRGKVIAALVVESTKPNAVVRKCRLQSWLLKSLTLEAGYSMEIAIRELTHQKNITEADVDVIENEDADEGSP